MDDDDDDHIIYVYILAPITVVVAVGVFLYICIQSRRLKEEMISNGQLITVMPTIIAPSTTWQQIPPPTSQNLQHRLQNNIVTPAPISPLYAEQIAQPSMETTNWYSPKGLPPPPPYTR